MPVLLLLQLQHVLLLLQLQHVVLLLQLQMVPTRRQQVQRACFSFSWGRRQWLLLQGMALLLLLLLLLPMTKTVRHDSVQCCGQEL